MKCTRAITLNFAKICHLQNVLAPNCKHPNSSSSNDSLTDEEYGVDPWDYQDGWPPFSKFLIACPLTIIIL